MDEKKIVRDYFNAIGFERWRRIYGNDTVSWVQQDIRLGHAQTVDTVLQWLGDVKGISICDAGCGVGSLSIPLAAKGGQVWATDISEQMIAEAQRRQQETLGQTQNPQFAVSDLETIQGQFNTVVCLDVMIHYPESDALRMVKSLTERAEKRLIFSFAPNTPLLSLLKKVGSFFPGSSKATRAYLHREALLVDHLDQLGWKVQQKTQIQTRFYFACLLDAVLLGNESVS
jgi:magnesium-protoporphyrin O-methyltransferase